MLSPFRCWMDPSGRRICEYLAAQYEFNAHALEYNKSHEASLTVVHIMTDRLGWTYALF